MAARQIQQERFKGEECRFNSQMGKRQIENCCGLKKSDERFLNDVFRAYGLSARGCEKILKTARTWRIWTRRNKSAGDTWGRPSHSEALKRNTGASSFEGTCP